MFKNKAENLNFLNKYSIKNIEIPKFIFFNLLEWDKNKKKIIKKICTKLKKKICIRSSYYLEDSLNSSMAGKFESFINITNNKKNILFSINNLIKQYQGVKLERGNFKKNYFLAQNFVEKSICSGVVTNYNLSDGAPYYSINYNDQSSSTLSVTSGDENSFRVLYVSRKSKGNIRSLKFKKLIDAIKEIEKIYNQVPLDIEFAIKKNLKICILQIRPISTSHKWQNINNRKFNKLLKLNQNKFLKIKKRNIAYGNKAIFGLMPDWNPAEIIGFQPNLFSYSLYKYLVTDRIWAKARETMGYKKLNNPKLMYSFTGKPYIDLRMSFSSFLPSNLNPKIENKIINFWLNELMKKPFLHDKIEFEITDNCFYFGLGEKIKKKYNFLNSKEKNQFYLSLKNLTNNIFKNFEKDFEEMNNNITNLEKYRKDILVNYLKIKKNEVAISKNLFDKCKTLGLIPFSKQARNAFISKKILSSLVEKKIISKKSYFNILSHLKTVSHDFIIDQKKKEKKIISRASFNKKYYHLRPNTYDIMNERSDKFIKINELDNSQINSLLNFQYRNIKSIIKKKEYKKIKEHLNKKKIKLDVERLLIFCISSLKLRENYKFIFSRTLSDGIELLRNFSKKNMLKNKLSGVDVKHIFKISDKKSIKKINLKYEKNNKDGEYYSFVKLPYLIVSKNDFFVSSILLSKPNFISDKNISGEIIFLDGKSKKINLKNKIVVIENADPGFDWIFLKNIKGLITKFGGVNSHMSIRCEELNIPAIIGFGEDNFSKLKKKSFVNINCNLQKINLLN